jgi:hypothetical protein
VRAITREELLTQSPASHYVKSWSGIVDPKDSTRVMTNPVWAQLTQKEPRHRRELRPVYYFVESR